MSARTKWVFEVPGPIRGYQKSLRHSFSREYVGWKTLIRYHANVAGVPQELDPRCLYSVTTEFYWTGKARIDASNAHKAVEDGLWKRDRLVYQIASYQYPNMDAEKVRVTVEKLV